MSDSRLGADERELTARALHGDEEALGRLLALHQGWAYNLAYRVLAHEADARDAVQDAFLTTVRALRGDGSPPRNVDSFKPWLRRVVSNAAVTQIRRRNGVHARSVGEVEESLPGPSSVEPGPAAEQVELRGQVLQALLGLPETQRVALALREYLGASYDEIAETLDLPRTAIGTLLFRARAAFRSSYERVAESAPPIDCPDLVPLFASIIDGESQPADWLTLEAHLKGCEACSDELESQRRARRMYAILPLLALPAGWEPIKAALGGAAGAAASSSAAASVPPPPPADPAGALAPGATAGLGASAPGATASGLATAGSAAPTVASGGLTGGGLAGVFAGASGLKLTVAALATAAVVGVGVVAAPFGAQAPSPEAAPSPAAALVLSPVPGAAASPGGVDSPPGAVASPGGAPALTASPVPAVAPPTILTSGSPTPGASPAPGASPPPVTSPSPAANGPRPPGQDASLLAAAPVGAVPPVLLALASPMPPVASPTLVTSPMPRATATDPASPVSPTAPTTTATASPTPAPSPTPTAASTSTASSTPAAGAPTTPPTAVSTPTPPPTPTTAPRMPTATP